MFQLAALDSAFGFEYFVRSLSNPVEHFPRLNTQSRGSNRNWRRRRWLSDGFLLAHLKLLFPNNSRPIAFMVMRFIFRTLPECVYRNAIYVRFSRQHISDRRRQYKGTARGPVPGYNSITFYASGFGGVYENDRLDLRRYDSLGGSAK